MSHPQPPLNFRQISFIFLPLNHPSLSKNQEPRTKNNEQSTKNKEQRTQHPPSSFPKVTKLPEEYSLASSPFQSYPRYYMKTVTIKLPEALDKKLRQHAKAKKQGLSEILRGALERELECGSDFASLAAPYRGMFKGPFDLSEREGYGNQKSC